MLVDEREGLVQMAAGDRLLDLRNAGSEPDPPGVDALENLRPRSLLGAIREPPTNLHAWTYRVPLRRSRQSASKSRQSLRYNEACSTSSVGWDGSSSCVS